MLNTALLHYIVSPCIVTLYWSKLSNVTCISIVSLSHQGFVWRFARFWWWYVLRMYTMSMCLWYINLHTLHILWQSNLIRIFFFYITECDAVRLFCHLEVALIYVIFSLRHKNIHHNVPSSQFSDQVLD